MMSGQEGAETALFVVYAMDMHCADPTNLAPPLDARLTADWVLRGWLTAIDAAFVIGSGIQRAASCYGYLAESKTTPGRFVCAIRGTNGFLEWIEDAEFVPTPHPVAGLVEQGFWGIYRTLTFRDVAGTMAPAAQGIKAAVGDSGTLTVAGHSLGAPLATYLAFDLAPHIPAPRLRAALYASPRPGDLAFGKAFAARVADYTVWNYDLDVVPRVPRGFDYDDLPGVIWLSPRTAQAHIQFSLDCHHHLASYAAMLNYHLLDWPTVFPQDPCIACIKGPAPP